MSDKFLEKLESLLKEEKWGRIDPKKTGISKFTILDDFLDEVNSEGSCKEISDKCREHLKSESNSIAALYLVGVIGFQQNILEDKVCLRKLIDIFLENKKWAVVERIAEKILGFGENRVALKALATSLEKLGRKREAIPVWEELLKMDRFDAEIAKKLALAILNEDETKAIYYLKLSIEGYIKNNRIYDVDDQVTELWTKLVSLNWEDLSFFFRIERILVKDKETDFTASLLRILLNKYKELENDDVCIEILKKMLTYVPEDVIARRNLIKLYEKKYESHSQLQQFLELSKMNDYGFSVKHAIVEFEKNIIFDIGNFVYHRTRGVGKIAELDSENIFIDFRDVKAHKMSVKMALKALTPVDENHFYVQQYIKPNEMHALFENDFMAFFGILIYSFGGTISLADLKRLLIPEYVDLKNWPKWWTKARTAIKKDPSYGTPANKKNEFFVRDEPVTFSDELLAQFNKTDSFSKKMDIAIEFVGNIDENEGVEGAQYFVDYFIAEAKGKSTTRLILSYFILTSFAKYVDPTKMKLGSIREKCLQFIQNSDELPMLSMKIGSYDYKKDLVDLVEEARPDDWTTIVFEFLFETPIRGQKYIISKLINKSEVEVVNRFISRAFIVSRESPEVFLWVAKNILNGLWNYAWLDYSYEKLLLVYFRFLLDLKKIEKKGNRLKNIAVDALFANEMALLKNIIESSDEVLLSKLYDIFKDVSYVPESEIETFYNLIKEKYPDFSEVTTKEKYVEKQEEKILATQEGFANMAQQLKHMINVELPLITKELAKTASISSDVRENVEYNHMLEKQNILKKSINEIEERIKKAEIVDLENIDSTVVSFGTKIVVENTELHEQSEFIILGPWEADFSKRILSYTTPIASALLGHKIGEEVTLKQGEMNKTFIIKDISKYSL